MEYKKIPEAPDPKIFWSDVNRSKTSEFGIMWQLE